MQLWQWVKNLTTSTLAFDITQFFPSLNHQLLSLILDKASLNQKISAFFKNYLIGRKTKYLWNRFLSPFCNVDIGVGQGSALSPILSVLYLFFIFHILEKWLKTLKIPISFVDDGLFILQNKSISFSNANLFYSYNIISSLLTKFELVIEHGKTEVFHFSKSYEVFLPSLDFTSIWRPVLLLKAIWQYLGFFFDWKLTFQYHIDFYTNKAISMIKYMKILGNLSRGINPFQKRQLYKCCALPIALYSFQLWYYNKALLNYPLNILRKMQQRSALWVSRAFWMSPTTTIEAISDLIPIHLYFKKLYTRFLLWGLVLSTNHIIKSILSSDGSTEHTSYTLSLDNLTPKQELHLNSLLIDIDNRHNELHPSFSFFDKEFNPGNWLIDSFSDQFSFHPCSSNIKNYMKNLDDITFKTLSNPSFSIVISDASIKNHVATSIAHIHSHDKPVIKTIH